MIRRLTCRLAGHRWQTLSLPAHVGLWQRCTRCKQLRFLRRLGSAVR